MTGDVAPSGWYQGHHEVAVLSGTWTADALLGIAGAMAGEPDPGDLLARVHGPLAEIVGDGDAALVVPVGAGRLRVVAASSRLMSEVEEHEAQTGEGPAAEAFQRCTPVVGHALDDTTRWPSFTAMGRDAGYRTVNAFPLHHEGDVVGTLSLFTRGTGRTPDDTRMAAAEALAHMAAIVIVHYSVLRRATLQADQLQRALRSRIAIEQAKGILSERLRVDMAGAFDLLRAYSQHHNERIGEVASGVVDGRLSDDDLRAGGRRAGPPATQRNGGQR